jgi:predicted TIM-barrel fold metal-dependent hydrolase
MREVVAAMPTIYSFPWPEWSEDDALAQMDRWGIQAQVVSLTDPGLRLVEPSRRAEVARRCNEEMAALVRAHPTRFGGLAAVPLPDPAEAVAEVVHALDVLGLDGVGLLSSQDGLYLGDPALEPLLAAMNERSCWALIHPAAIGQRPALPLPPPTLEFAFDLTRSAADLIVRGRLQQYPEIRWCLAQAGGTLPFLASRISAFMAMPESVKLDLGLPPSALEMTPDDVIEAVGRFYFDTALSVGPATLQALRASSALDHVLYGSDLPFAGFARGGGSDELDPAPALSETFSAEERRQIERGNALAQFPRLASMAAVGI